MQSNLGRQVGGVDADIVTLFCLCTVEIKQPAAELTLFWNSETDSQGADDFASGSFNTTGLYAVFF